MKKDCLHSNPFLGTNQPNVQPSQLWMKVNANSTFSFADQFISIFFKDSKVYNPIHKTHTLFDAPSHVLPPLSSLYKSFITTLIIKEEDSTLQENVDPQKDLPIPMVFCIPLSTF